MIWTTCLIAAAGTSSAVPPSRWPPNRELRTLCNCFWTTAQILIFQVARNTYHIHEPVDYDRFVRVVNKKTYWMTTSLETLETGNCRSRNSMENGNWWKARKIKGKVRETYWSWKIAMSGLTFGFAKLLDTVDTLLKCNVAVTLLFGQ